MKTIHCSISVACLMAVAFPCLGAGSKVDEMKVEIEELKAKLEELAGGEDPTQKAMDNIEIAREQVESAKLEIEEIEEELRKSEYLLGVYKQAFRIVPKITPGTSLGANVTLSDGSTLQNVVFVGTARGGIKVESSAGPRVIEFSQIPAGWSQYFAVPPQIASPSGNLAALIAAKPDSAWTDQARKTHEQELALANVEPESPIGEVEGGAAESSSATEPAAPEGVDMGRITRNKERVQEVMLLRGEYNRIAKAQRDAKREKYQKLESFRRMKIKKAQAQIDNAMKVFDDEIDKLQGQLDEIQMKITKINASME